MEVLISVVNQTLLYIYDRITTNGNNLRGAVENIWKVIAVELGNRGYPDMTSIVWHLKINFTIDRNCIW
jgi:hypothetical protein